MRAYVFFLVLVLGLVGYGGCDHDGPPNVPGSPDNPDNPGDPEPPGTTYWWNDTVFYEIFVRSFYDSDGDGIGDLQGLIQKLDYLNDGDPATDTDLGVTGLWLMPITQSPSYHGYDTTDYRTVENDYGTNADFQQLMVEAHARGIKVIVDYVMNHCSNQHPWFTASVADDPDYADWFSWRADNPGWSQPWGGGQVWHSGARGYYYGVFWSGMPDLNYGTPAVETEMFDVADHWLTTMGADGFRLDAVKYLMEDGSVIDNAPSTFAFWGRFRDHVDVVAPDAFVVGEAWDSTDIVLQYIDAGMHTCFEFDLANSIIGAANSGQPEPAANKITQVAADFPFLQYATFLTNHDQRRVLSQLGGDSGRNKIAAAILLTGPGVPFVFYGEEIGMVSSWDHPDVRRPMAWDSSSSAGFTTGVPWQQPASNSASNNVATMQQNDASLWNQYRQLVKARTASIALRRGSYQTLVSSSGQLLAFMRYHPDQTVVAVHNLRSGTFAGWTLSATSSLLSPGTFEAIDLITGASLNSLTVTTDGAIDGWSPTSYVTGYGSLLVELIPATR